MGTFLASRRKAVFGAVGIVVNLLYVYNASKPNVYISAVLAALAVLGIHQASNAA